MPSSTQWRPYARRLVETPNALSRAIMQGMPDAASNYLAHVINPKAWSQAFYPPVKTVVVNSTAQLVLCPFPPVQIPDIYDKFCVQCRARRISGSGTVSLRLYIADSLYYGPGGFSAEYLNQYSYVQISTISSTNWDIKTNFYTFNARDVDDRVWFILTSYTTNSGQAEISNLDVTVTNGSSFL